MSAVRAGNPAGPGGAGTPPGGAGLGLDQLPGVVSGLSRQNSVYRRTMAVCDKIAGAAVQGADAAELTSIFAEMAGKSVVLLDPQFRLQAQAGAGPPERWGSADATLARLFRLLAAERRTLRVPPLPGSALARGCLATPVVVGDVVLGYLLLLDETDGEADDADLIVASYAATLFALTLARERTSLELGLRYQGAVVDSLVSGHFLDSQDAQRKARVLGVAAAQPYRVAIARLSPGAPPAGPARPEGPDSAGDLLSRLAGTARCPAVVRGPELVMLLPDHDAPEPAGHGGGPGPVSPAAATELLREQAGGQLTCGLSEPTRLPELAPEALRQAQHAADLGIRIGRAGQTISYEELGVYRLLLQIGDMHKLGQFARDVLGALIDYDTRHKLDLVGTLSAYLNQHESLKQTARVLRVHVNTVSYRIQRIERLTSLNLGDPDDRLSAHVAAKIIQSQRAVAPSGQPPPGRQK